MLKADPYLERSIITHQHIEKMLSLHCMLCEKKASTVKTTRYMFFYKEIEHFYFQYEKKIQVEYRFKCERLHFKHLKE